MTAIIIIGILWIAVAVKGLVSGSVPRIPSPSERLQDADWSRADADLAALR